MNLSTLTAAVDAASIIHVILAVAASTIGIALVTLAVNKVRGAISPEREDDEEDETPSSTDEDDNDD